jgi:hypothetical protein
MEQSRQRRTKLQRKKKPAAPGGGATGYVLAGEGSGGTGVIVLPK